MKYILGALLLTFVYFDCKSQDWMPYKVENAWGFKDRQGEVQIPAQFQFVSMFSNNIAIVAKNNFVGAIDSSNTLIIPFQFDYLQPLGSMEFLFGYKTKYFGEYRMGVMNRDGKVKIPADYYAINQQNGIYKVTMQQDSIISTGPAGDVRAVKSIYGLLDKDGKVLIPCEYTYLSWITDSLIDVSKDVEINDHALFDTKGNQLTDFGYMVFGNPVDGTFKARIGDRYGFFDYNGKIIIPVQFEYCEDFKNGYAMIMQKGKWGAIDKAGKVIIEPNLEYDQVEPTLLKKDSK